MFKDDRMMSMLTWTLVMLLIGTFIHRSDMVSDFFNGEATRFALVRDEATVPANRLTPIDVLANDTGLRSGDTEALQITRQPACGRVFVRWGEVHYLPAERCAGSQTFGYTIAGRGEVEGEVIATVVLSDAARGSDTAAPAPAPEPAAAPTPQAAPSPDQVAVATPQAPAATPSPTPVQPAAPQPATGNAETAPAVAVQPSSGGTGLQTDHSAPGRLAAAEGDAATPPPETAPTAALQQALPDSARPAAAPAAPAPMAQQPARSADDGPSAVLTAAPDAPAATAPVPAPAPEAPCNVLPSITVDVGPGAHTTVSVEAPCDAGQVARLGYDMLEFGLALDGSGRGSVTVPGLQPSSEAELLLPSGDGLAFELPFADTNRLDRVAIIWDAPVRLDLHAFEFGARPGSGGHVSPQQPRSFAAVRRHGGGYLMTYDPLGGTGQHIDLYSYWRRPGSATGVIKLKVDFVSRTGGGQSATCGSGDLAQPEFRVLRMQAGRLARPELRRMMPLDCTAVTLAERLIGGAVDDVLVLRK